jgi:hypothetical protein
MIQSFEKPEPLEPVSPTRFQWPAALTAGIIAGALLLIVPRGSPWEGISFFSPVILGRSIPETAGIGFPTTALVHLLLAAIYGLLVSRLVSNITQLRAVLVGGVVGVLLYLANFGIITLGFPSLRGHELSVILTHIVFGLVAAGAYRGLLRRQPMIAPPPT